MHHVLGSIAEHRGNSVRTEAAGQTPAHQVGNRMGGWRGAAWRQCPAQINPIAPRWPIQAVSASGLPQPGSPGRAETGPRLQARVTWVKS